MFDRLKTLGARLLGGRNPSPTPQPLRACEVDSWLEPAQAAKWRGLVLEVCGPNTGETVSYVAGTLPRTGQLTAIWRNQPATAPGHPAGLPECIDAAPRVPSRSVRLFLFLQVPRKDWTPRLVLSLNRAETFTRGLIPAASVRSLGLAEAMALLSEHEALWSVSNETAGAVGMADGSAHGDVASTALFTQLYSHEATRLPALAGWKAPGQLSLPELFCSSRLLLQPHENAWLSLTLSPDKAGVGLWRTYGTLAIQSSRAPGMANRSVEALLSSKWPGLTLLTSASALAWARAPLRNWCSLRAPVKSARLWSEPLSLRTICSIFSTPAGLAVQRLPGESDALRGLVISDSLGQRHPLEARRFLYNPSVLITGCAGSGLTFHSNLLALSNWLKGQHVLRISWEPLKPMLRDVVSARELPSDLGRKLSVNPLWGFSSLVELHEHLDLICAWLVNVACWGGRAVSMPDAFAQSAFNSLPHRHRLRKAAINAWQKHQGALGFEAVWAELERLAYADTQGGGDAVALAPDWSGDMLDALKAAQLRIGPHLLEGAPYLQPDTLALQQSAGESTPFLNWFPDLDRDVYTSGAVVPAALICYAAAQARAVAKAAGSQGEGAARATLVLDELGLVGRDIGELLPLLIQRLRNLDVSFVCSTSDSSFLQSGRMQLYGSVIFLRPGGGFAVDAIAATFGEVVATQVKTLRSGRQGGTLLWVQQEQPRLLCTEWSPAMSALLAPSWQVTHAYEAARGNGASFEQAMAAASAKQ